MAHPIVVAVRLLGALEQALAIVPVGILAVGVACRTLVGLATMACLARSAALHTTLRRWVDHVRRRAASRAGVVEKQRVAVLALCARLVGNVTAFTRVWTAAGLFTALAIATVTFVRRRPAICTHALALSHTHTHTRGECKEKTRRRRESTTEERRRRVKSDTGTRREDQRGKKGRALK